MINNDFLCFYLCSRVLTIGRRRPTFQCSDPITLPSATSLKWHQLDVIHMVFFPGVCVCVCVGGGWIGEFL